MRIQAFRNLLSPLASLFAIVLIAATAWSQETVLYSFSDPNGDVLPQAGVISDANGNLYGTTFYGGTYGMGTVYELSPGANGWTETILHSFNVDGIDGFFPTGSLIFDSAGNLFGTAQFGGTGNCSVGFGCGVIFKLSPAGNGSWNETILHDFMGSDGWQVHAGLVFDSKGNLYGTTANGGAFGWGTVFELSPAKNGSWTLKQLHSFSGGMEGGVPYGTVVLDSAGNIYGLAYEGGGVSSECRYGCGTVFELIRGQNRKHWTGKVLHNFTTSSGDGHYPYGSVVFDKQGNLYATASAGGGSSDSGIVFELSPSSSGEWNETVIHNFNDSATDGAGPSAGLVFDSAGNLYGTTISGGSDGQGTVFELTPAGGATWTESILHSFSNQQVDGYNPNGGLMLDKAGNLYGVTDNGGQNQDGAVFEVAH
ncbi:MAG: choice-of-anchor tandem repeat GloVer-containing protein [Candidatus Sulfotelmatobacter sp.]